jgi:hypothetical protein
VASSSQVPLLTDSHYCWFNQPTFQTPTLFQSSVLRTVMMAITVGDYNAGLLQPPQAAASPSSFTEFRHRGRFKTYSYIAFFSTAGMTTARPDYINQQTSR